jgi:arginyl-tRNA synthetase
VSPGHALPAAFETPRQAEHGDLAVTAAMPLAKAQRRNPREVAAELIAALRAKTAVERWVESIAVAGPGFINLHLRAAARQQIVAEVLADGAAFGTRRAGGEPVIVEFVSANPTGPLHVGHARQAALGDAICNLLETQGRRVMREFYYNDAGVQIATLAQSVQARLDGLKPGDPGWPEAAYNGDYIADIAADFAAGKTVRADDREFTASGRRDDLDGIRQFAVAYLRHEQDLDLRAFGVRFDNYYLESSLYASGRVEATVARLVAAGKTYEDGGALWLRTSEYGDDKDRVMRKSDGTYTYFVPDVAYHLAKFERGFTTAINIQGTDHHGTIARVRAGLQAAGAGVPARYPEYVLNTMVRVERGGAEVKISKRAGSYVTLRDLIDWTSRDAVRFFMLSRKADTEFTFDVDLALKQNDENPVFYVQYAHARICSVLEQYRAQGGDRTGFAEADLGLLTAPSETALLRKLAEYPSMLAAAAASLAPHEIAFYLRELAATFHSYYAAERFLVDDAALARTRMALLAATRQIVRNALAVLGVGAPERMMRETETA